MFWVWGGEPLEPPPLPPTGLMLTNYLFLFGFIIPARVWIPGRIEFFFYFLFARFHMKMKSMDLFLLLCWVVSLKKHDLPGVWGTE